MTGEYYYDKVICIIYIVHFICTNNCSCVFHKYPIREASGGVTEAIMVLGKYFSKLMETLVWKGIFCTYINCT